MHRLSARQEETKNHLNSRLNEGVRQEKDNALNPQN
jgi:hypothetical protein